MYIRRLITDGFVEHLCMSLADWTLPYFRLLRTWGVRCNFTVDRMGWLSKTGVAGFYTLYYRYDGKLVKPSMSWMRWEYSISDRKGAKPIE